MELLLIGFSGLGYRRFRDMEELLSLLIRFVVSVCLRWVIVAFASLEKHLYVIFFLDIRQWIFNLCFNIGRFIHGVSCPSGALWLETPCVTFRIEGPCSFSWFQHRGDELHTAVFLTQHIACVYATIEPCIIITNCYYLTRRLQTWCVFRNAGHNLV